MNTESNILWQQCGVIKKTTNDTINTTLSK